ncbi:unnamed protein product [Cylicostephanus goldi]|uniref:CWH43-like N-terminal domain-containing protein n=1 Tax=Cylicostephanus goldi TaxID=71465 RepID=A0A3P6SW05_CYLGO|nr:unnamed protein product [Cylicostephanus goldi]
MCLYIFDGASIKFFFILHTFHHRNYLLFSPLRPLTGVRMYRLLCNISCILEFLENLFLLGLTAISSIENHGLHKLCFCGFAITATIYMLLSTWLFHYSGRRRATNLGERSYEYKILACACSIISMMLATYLYWRHNTYCEPGVYTMFALAEYCVVIANIAFHSTLYYDFNGKSVILGSTVGVGSSGYTLLPTHIEKDT